MSNLIGFRSVHLVITLCFVFFITPSYATTVEKGITEYKSQNYEEALEIFNNLLKKDGDNTIVYFYIGLIHKQVGNYETSIENYLRAANGTPSIKDAYTEMTELFINLGRFSEARNWIEKSELEQVKPAYTAYLRGLLLSKESKYSESVAAFQRAKELDRSLEQLASFQIAMIYGKEKKFDKLKANLKAVISVDPSSDMATFAKEYEEALNRSLREYRAWNFTAGISYLHDDNVIAAPSSSVPGVITSDKRDSSIAATFGVNYTPIVESPYFFSAQYNLYSNTYFSLKEYNVLSNSITLTPGISIGQGMATLPLSYTYQMLGQEKYMGLFTIRPSYGIMLSDKSLLQASLGYGYRDMMQPVLLSDEDRSANIYSASLAYYCFIKEQNRGFINLRYEYSYEDTKGVNWKNNGNRFSIGFIYPLFENLLFSISGDMYLQKYKNRHSVFNIKRDDKIYSTSLLLTWEILKNLNATVQYAHMKSDSNIAIYDYKRNVYNLSLQFIF